MEETKDDRNQRRIDLHCEIGGAIGPIVERETSVELKRACDCIDCLLTHATELMTTYYNLSAEDGMKIFKIMTGQSKQFINIKLRKNKRDRDKTQSEIIIPNQE